MGDVVGEQGRMMGPSWITSLSGGKAESLARVSWSKITPKFSVILAKEQTSIANRKEYIERKKERKKSLTR